MGLKSKYKWLLHHMCEDVQLAMMIWYLVSLVQWVRDVRCGGSEIYLDTCFNTDRESCLDSDEFCSTYHAGECYSFSDVSWVMRCDCDNRSSCTSWMYFVLPIHYMVTAVVTSLMSEQCPYFRWAPLGSVIGFYIWHREKSSFKLAEVSLLMIIRAAPTVVISVLMLNLLTPVVLIPLLVVNAALIMIYTLLTLFEAVFGEVTLGDPLIRSVRLNVDFTLDVIVSISLFNDGIIWLFACSLAATIIPLIVIMIQDKSVLSGVPYLNLMASMVRDSDGVSDLGFVSVVLLSEISETIISIIYLFYETSVPALIQISLTAVLILFTIMRRKKSILAECME